MAFAEAHKTIFWKATLNKLEPNRLNSKGAQK